MRHRLSRSVLPLLGRAFVLCWCVMSVGVAGAQEKVYEKPSAFMKRHFGGVPKTQVLKLNAKQSAGLKKIFGHKYPEKKIRYWQGNGRTAWILQEIGKSEPITTGVVVRNGKISELKVLIYRESHGWEVTRPFFTKQFVGASLKGDRLSTRVDGIVGATLSVNALKKVGAAALYLTQQVGN
ncbi:FMN-binding protein [Sulfuriroseicoccus oceanibius]|uniref:FMN-binding protein n=1 Tax=Sulfuriroseicoccus oceanibius TaxID=2707525 RepID=A0A7T7EZR7_9BACT|nr:FMN-binding protein [Sulfuriroseicoccus oceanibius]QQL44161.1 FMN-binding protein [Sulfuriroseicoccus oceanibius]